MLCMLIYLLQNYKGNKFKPHPQTEFHFPVQGCLAYPTCVLV